MKKDINDEIIIGYPKLRIALPVLIAYKKNFFQKYKLQNVKIKEYPTAEKMMNSFVSEENKIYLGGFCALPIAFNVIHEHDINLMFIAGLYEDDSNPISFLLVKYENETINDIKDLEGKRIGIFPTKAYRIWIKQILEKNGIAMKECDIIDVPISEQSEQLNNGSVDVLFTSDPMATEITFNKIGKKLLLGNALVPKALALYPFYFGSFVVNKEYAEGNEDIVHRLALALDDAILEMNKNKFIIQNTIQTYLPESQKLFQHFSKLLFKKTNEVSNSDLKIIEKFYYHQGIFLSPINTENMQYELIQWQDKVKRLFEPLLRLLEPLSIFLEKHPKLLSMIAYPILLFIGVTVTTMKLNEAYAKNLIQENKSMPSEIDFKYIDKNYNERVEILNIGKSKINNLKIMWEFYFISENDDIYQSSNMVKVVELNKALFDKVKKDGFIKFSSDFNGLFGREKKEITISSLAPKSYYYTKENMVENSQPLDISSSAIQHALRLNKIIGTKVFTRWKIKYYENFSGKKRISYKYIWLNNNERIDLEDVVGGRRIIKLIKQYDENTKNIIFKKLDKV